MTNATNLVCAAEGCRTILSRYNRSLYCSVHIDPRVEAAEQYEREAPTVKRTIGGKPPRYTDGELLVILVEKARALGRVPQMKEMTGPGATGYTYRRRFDGWFAALGRVGMAPRVDIYSPTERRTLAVLQGEPMTIHAITNATGRTYQATSSTLSQLRRRGAVERIEKRGDNWWAPRVFYRAARMEEAA